MFLIIFKVILFLSHSGITMSVCPSVILSFVILMICIKASRPKFVWLSQVAGNSERLTERCFHRTVTVAYLGWKFHKLSIIVYQTLYYVVKRCTQTSPDSQSATDEICVSSSSVFHIVISFSWRFFCELLFSFYRFFLQSLCEAS